MAGKAEPTAGQKIEIDRKTVLVPSARALPMRDREREKKNMPGLVQKEKVGSVSGKGRGRATVFVPIAPSGATQLLLLLLST